MTIPGDNPITDKKDDLLGRHGLAEAFAMHVLAQDVSDGAVVGVLGAWGSGKTSFVNLARSNLESGASAVVDFNPWMFSGAEQLVSSFFIEIAAQLQLKTGLQDVGRELSDYGEAFAGMGWLPYIGPWIERLRGIAKLLNKLWQRRKQGISEVRKRVVKALSELDRPMVVVLDDIDRLETNEIRDVFKLVRLTASFPNIIYVVAFDRVRVERALQQDGIPGRDYLEKILMIAVDLPAIPRQVLDRQTTTAIDSALSEISRPGPFDEQAWPDLFMEIIKPLIRNMRDVRRYVASLRGTVVELEGEVALADVMSLEAIRVFLPDVFSVLHESVEALTTPASMDYGARDYESERWKAQIDRLTDVAEGEQSGIAEAMIRRLFPAAERHLGGTNYGHDWQNSWLKNRRVAHKDILAFYLERVAGEGLRAFQDAERAWALMSDAEGFDKYLRSLDNDRLESVIASLEAFEDDYSPEHVVPGTVILLNLLPDLPDRPRGMFDLDTRLVVSRVTYRLLRSLKDPDLIKQAVEEALPQINSLSSKSEVVSDVGYREGARHKLVSEADADVFERAWRDEVRAATPAELAIETDLLRVLLVANKEAERDGEAPIGLADDPDLTRAVLKAAKSEVRSQPMGSRSITRSTRLAWDVLVDLYGDEDTLRQRLEDLAKRKPEDIDDVLQLADRYLDGWRPND